MAKNDEVAHSFQPFMGAHGGQVADPVIEAEYSLVGVVGPHNRFLCSKLEY